VQELWANDISAELSIDAHSPDELLNDYKDDKHSWFVIIKQDSGDFGEKQLKVKSMDKKEDYDIRGSELLGFLKNEFRERHQREGTNERAKLLRRSSHPDTNLGLKEKEADVRVLIPQHRGKKSNRRNVIEAGKLALFRATLASLEKVTLETVLMGLCSATKSPGTCTRLPRRTDSRDRSQRRRPRLH